jgi:serine/threonine protein kinase
MGVVFEAVDVRRGNRVALKMLPQVDGPRLYRFKREFRSAADLSHPNLIGLHSLEVDGAQWFFTMDLIEGVDFLDYVRPSNQLDTARLSSAVSQLASGVMALHRNHIIHRDLKPSNVMVARAPARSSCWISGWLSRRSFPTPRSPSTGSRGPRPTWRRNKRPGSP